MGRTFFWAIAMANFFALLLLVSVVFSFLRRMRDASTARKAPTPAGTQSLTVLLPCYLPNEEGILPETIVHILEILEYEYPFTLLLCYNTPKPLDFEEELAAANGRVYRNGRTLRVLRVDGSTSKAENLNEGLKLVHSELVAIYDADHHPDPGSLLTALAHMEAHDVTCVQGSTYLRAKNSLLAAYIDAEFFVTHFVIFPALQWVSGTAVFGGSNALWKTDELKRFQFRHDVQTEDIELSTRALLDGRVKISFEPNCRSGELPPSSLAAFYRQRLRWVMGWDQVTLMHMTSIWSSRLGCREKAGLCYMLPLRWVLLLAATLNVVVTPAVALLYREMSCGYLGQPIDGIMTLSAAAFVAISAVVGVNAVVHEPPLKWPALVVFQMSGSLYVLWQLLLVLISLMKISCGSVGEWAITERGVLPGRRPALASLAAGTGSSVNGGVDGGLRTPLTASVVISVSPSQPTSFLTELL